MFKYQLIYHKYFNKMYSFGCAITFPFHMTFNIPHQNYPYFNSQKEPQKTKILPRWMEGLPNNTKISYLSIPGTHNSGTYSCGWFQASFKTQCQRWSIYDQLQAGIRFLDMRLTYSGQQILMAHDIIKFNRLSQEIEQISRFLSQNPTQFVILAFKKQDDNGQDPSHQILNEFKGKINAIFSQQIPTVGDLRGKAWVFRGTDVNFENNLTYRVPGGGPGITDKNELYMQNFWTIKNNLNLQNGITQQQKVKHVMQAVQVAPTPTRMKFNFLSGVGDKIYLHPQPFQLAKNQDGPNSNLYKALQKNQKVCLGLTIMDFPGQVLIYKIVQTNFS